MTLKDFEFKPDNHFVAMEYYGLILNRTYLVLITSNELIGIKVNGLVGVESGSGLFDFSDFVVKEVSKAISIRGDLYNPYSYIKTQYLKKYEGLDILDRNKTNSSKHFIIKKREIKNVFHDEKKKWGMGNYPHDGKVYIETLDGKKREFIILGNQSGVEIVTDILVRNLNN
jgi:hypothetical protein